MKNIILFLISFVSASFRALGLRSCRFYPTCSCYAKEAFHTRPLLEAFKISTTRLLRCQPFSAGGYDPLPKEN